MYCMTINLSRGILIFTLGFLSLFSYKINENVLICGVAKDIEDKLDRSIPIIENIAALFKNTKLLIYENNSTDKTLKILKNWANENSNIWLKSEFLTREQFSKEIVNTYPDGNFFIPEMISRARNIVLKEALSDKYKDYPYIIWIDMDFFRHPDYDGFVDTFNITEDWDAIFAYGIAPDNCHWDWYAFRNTDTPIASELLGNDWWYHMPQNFSCNRKDPLIPVYSAFGGCGIYKKDSIKIAHYSALVTEDLEWYMKDILSKNRSHKQVKKYYRFNNHLNGIRLIEKPMPNLPKITDENIGIILSQEKDPIIWRMSSKTHQFPTVCEHVPLHASMARQGHGKFFVNPRLVFRY